MSRAGTLGCWAAVLVTLATVLWLLPTGPAATGGLELGGGITLYLAGLACGIAALACYCRGTR